jgi:hypothetical protein
MIRTGRYCILAMLFLGPIQPAGAVLRIEILRGEGANNNAATNSVTSPVVRVWDSNGPLSGALVVFTAPETGASVVFSGSGAAGEAITDESGTASSPRVQPTGGNGSVTIQVMASKNKEFAQAVIHQMNLGLGQNGAPQGELNIVELEGDSGPGRGLTLHVRVDDGRDHPVAGAAVAFALRKTDKFGRTVESWRGQSVSDERGEAQYTVPKLPGGARVEFEVRAVIQDKIATRYFPAK